MSAPAGRLPVTAAMRVLREHGVEFSAHTYAWEEKGGTAASAQNVGVDEHAVIKTLVMEDDAREPMIVLMHGDRQVSTKRLARILGKRTVLPCKPDVAERHSGYLVGGTSPFGTKRGMPVYVERSIVELERVWINGGRRGFLVGLDPREIVRVLGVTLVEVGIEG